MTQTKNTTQLSKGKHLSYEERLSIQHWHREGRSNREIARRLNRAPQTIHNEIKRGTVTQVTQQKQHQKTYRYSKQIYFADSGQRRYEDNRKKCRRPYKWVEYPFMLEKLDEQMNKTNQFAPDIALCNLRKHAQFPKGSLPCTSTLYNWIDQGFLKTKNIDLLLKTRRNTKKKRVRKNKTILGLSIEERPEEVDLRQVFGHWEIDTVVGKKGTCDAVLITLIERKTRFEIILKAESKEARAIDQAILGLREKLGDSFSKIFQSITSDNGVEFSGLTEILSPDVPVYFTHPYSSWERGTNENHNGIIRRFIPKGTELKTVPTSTVRKVQQWMNDLPRKLLGYQTPHEQFVREIKKLGIA